MNENGDVLIIYLGYITGQYSFAFISITAGGTSIYTRRYLGWSYQNFETTPKLKVFESKLTVDSSAQLRPGSCFF